MSSVPFCLRFSDEASVMTKKFIWAAILFFVAATQQLMAQVISSAVPFLLVAPNSRASGMGESGVALRPIRMLNIIDEYSRECLKIHIDRQVKATDVIYELSELFVERGAPDFLRSDNGSEFTAQPVCEWLQRLGVKTLFIEPGSPWENGYVESINGKLRVEPLNGEIFDTIHEAKVITERWREHYNTIRPHSSLQYRPPAPETYFLRQVANV